MKQISWASMDFLISSEEEGEGVEGSWRGGVWKQQ